MINIQDVEIQRLKNSAQSLKGQEKKLSNLMACQLPNTIEKLQSLVWLGYDYMEEQIHRTNSKWDCESDYATILDFVVWNDWQHIREREVGKQKIRKPLVPSCHRDSKDSKSTYQEFEYDCRWTRPIIAIAWRHYAPKERADLIEIAKAETPLNFYGKLREVREKLEFFVALTKWMNDKANDLIFTTSNFNNSIFANKIWGMGT